MAKFEQRRAIAHPERRVIVRRRPFWMPASGYYVLAIAISAAFFFLVWGILHDNGEETPWVTSGIGASILLVGFVLLRELIMRRSRSRFLAEQRRAPLAETVDPRIPGKLTIERNASILREIKKRSDAANVLNKFSAGHREVFELCAEYLNLIDDELKRVNAGSPRLGPLLNGRSKGAEYHRFHMLRWAEIEATELTIRAQTETNVSERAEAAREALAAVETAIASYPAERALKESHSLLTEMVLSIEVAYRVDEAEKATEWGDLALAKTLYRDALFMLGRDNVQNAEREQAASRINAAIEKIRLSGDQSL